MGLIQRDILKEGEGEKRGAQPLIYGVSKGAVAD